MMQKKSKDDRRRRPGFLLFELLVAMAFLAAATTIMLQMHQACLDYDRISGDRLRQQLNIENLAERLRDVAYEDVDASVTDLRAQSQVEILIESFKSDSRKGVHMILRDSSNDRPLVYHVWRLEPRS
ncbi:type IV pilus modification PilV family protein [Rhodopirellula sp. JC639]|uniref:type IV pilus modification PilV family protein n=1 Tax=Stieleria mannarensis TaxID=2755585 RepID=UPI001604339F|nr:acyltransferase [Rhodopirellula sp. JC639]